MTTWGAKCVLCEDVVCEGGTDDEAAASLDLHLRVTHGIEVES